ncbi:MAG: T9SS type A sorting domain-containing protein [Ginsengibacter sp.]
MVDNLKNLYPFEKSSSHVKNTLLQQVKTKGANLWQIFPGRARDMLNFTYNENEPIRTVINFVIPDATGKAVIRFRAASNNKQLSIPVNHLRTGIYFITINVGTDVRMNDKLIKK